jgi:hypothetical protein
VTKPLTDLKPANENPWYVLMTLSGEQEGDNIDEQLHQKNADFWNSYMGPVSNTSSMKRTEERNLVFRKNPERGAKAFDEITKRYRNQWIARHGDGGMVPPMPERNSDVDLSRNNFDKLFSVTDMYFERSLNISESKFKKNAFFNKCGFIKTVDISKIEITGNIHFSGSCFFSDFVAKDMKVLGTLMAKDVVIEGDFDLSNVQVAGTVT